MATSTTDLKSFRLVSYLISDLRENYVVPIEEAINLDGFTGLDLYEVWESDLDRFKFPPKDLIFRTRIAASVVQDAGIDEGAEVLRLIDLLATRRVEQDIANAEIRLGFGILPPLSTCESVFRTFAAVYWWYFSRNQLLRIIRHGQPSTPKAMVRLKGKFLNFTDDLAKAAVSRGLDPSPYHNLLHNLSSEEAASFSRHPAYRECLGGLCVAGENTWKAADRLTKRLETMLHVENDESIRAFGQNPPAPSGSPAEKSTDATESLAINQEPRGEGKKRRKSSNKESDVQIKLIAALTAHHEYDNGSCLNKTPVGCNELAITAKVAKGSASTFFKDRFGGHENYKVQCGKDLIGSALKLLNGEVPPKVFSANLRSEESRPGDRDILDELIHREEVNGK